MPQQPHPMVTPIVTETPITHGPHAPLPPSLPRQRSDAETLAYREGYRAGLEQMRRDLDSAERIMDLVDRASRL